MRDNKPLEKEALNLATYKIAKYHFLYSDPNCDKNGGDFLIHKECGNGLHKIIKCQSKGRNISLNSSSVKIAKSYVLDDFILFIYLKDDAIDKESIYLFFKKDIETWNSNDKEYSLRIPQNSIETGLLKEFYFDKKRASSINEIFSNIKETVKSEFITTYSDLNSLYLLWKETGSMPDAILTHKLLIDFDDYEHFSLDGLLFLLSISVYNEENINDYVGIDWAFQYLRLFNDISPEYIIENVKSIKTIYSSSAITYTKTFIEIVSYNRDKEQINGIRLVIGDKEEYFESYLFRDGNYSLRYNH